MAEAKSDSPIRLNKFNQRERPLKLSPTTVESPNFPQYFESQTEFSVTCLMNAINNALQANKVDLGIIDEEIDRLVLKERDEEKRAELKRMYCGARGISADLIIHVLKRFRKRYEFVPKSQYDNLKHNEIYILHGPQNINGRIYHHTVCIYKGYYLDSLYFPKKITKNFISPMDSIHAIIRVLEDGDTKRFKSPEPVFHGFVESPKSSPKSKKHFMDLTSPKSKKPKQVFIDLEEELTPKQKTTIIID